MSETSLSLGDYVLGKLGKLKGKPKPQDIKVFVATSRVGSDSLVVDWEEESDQFACEIEQMGSSAASDYGLDDTPGIGIWVFEGALVVHGYQCNNPLDPPEWDVDYEWEGRWRTPTAAELQRLAGEPPTPGLEELPWMG